MAQIPRSFSSNFSLRRRTQNQRSHSHVMTLIARNRVKQIRAALVCLGAKSKARTMTYAILYSMTSKSRCLAAMSTSRLATITAATLAWDSKTTRFPATQKTDTAHQPSLPIATHLSLLPLWAWAMVGRVIRKMFKAIIANDKSKMKAIIVFRKRTVALVSKLSVSNTPTIMLYDPVSECSNKWLTSQMTVSIHGQ